MSLENQKGDLTLTDSAGDLLTGLASNRAETSVRSLQRMVEIHDLRTELEQLRRENLALRDELEKSRMQGLTDDLTQLGNRRALSRSFSNLLERHDYGWKQREGKEIAVILLDIDHFKWVNDTHGHLAGDRVLIDFAQVLSKFVRRVTDRVFRYGGEEFVVILDGVSHAGAAQVAEALRLMIQRTEFGTMEDGKGVRLAITSSLGVTIYKENESPEETIQRADTLLYEAKQKGRNLVVADLS